MNIAEWVQSYGYAAVAAGTFLEGESVLLVAGAAAARGHLEKKKKNILQYLTMD